MLKRLVLLGLFGALLAVPAQAADVINSVASCGAAGSLVIPLSGPGYTAVLIDLSSTNQNGTIGFFTTGPRALAYVALPVTPIPSSPPVTTVVGTGGALTFQGVVQVVGYSSICITGTAWAGGSTSVVAVPVVGQWEPLFLDVPTGTSVSGYGTSTAPGAGAAVTTLTNPGAGNYDITVSASYGTGAVAAETDNMQLQVGGTVIQRLLIPPTANGLPVSYTFRRVNVPNGSTSITVNAVGAGTAAVPYKASLSIIPVN